jgi:hypothetical protein
LAIGRRLPRTPDYSLPGRWFLLFRFHRSANCELYCAPLEQTSVLVRFRGRFLFPESAGPKPGGSPEGLAPQEQLSGNKSAGDKVTSGTSREDGRITGDKIAGATAWGIIGT